MNKINDLQEQFESLIKQGQELLEKMKENHIADVSKKVKRWQPKYGDNYYYVDSLGDVGAVYYDTSAYGDLFRHKTGNCFRTEEEAQKELDRRIAEQEILDLCDWDGEEKAYIVDYDVKTNKFSWNWFYEITSPYRFATEESVKKAIDTLGTDKLKLIFRID